MVGYITSDYLDLGFTSHQIQNMTIKSFVSDTNNDFVLSWTEYKNNSKLAWNSLLEEKYYNGICFYSWEQLNHFKNINMLIETLIKKKILIGFAKEKILIKDQESLKNFKIQFQLYNQIKNNFQLGEWLESTSKFLHTTS
jgi:sporadic carbohydrate cluster protein (TIGR04323 family)